MQRVEIVAEISGHYAACCETLTTPGGSATPPHTAARQPGTANTVKNNTYHANLMAELPTGPIESAGILWGQVREGSPAGPVVQESYLTVSKNEGGDLVSLLSFVTPTGTARISITDLIMQCILPAALAMPEVPKIAHCMLAALASTMDAGSMSVEQRAKANRLMGEELERIDAKRKSDTDSIAFGN